MSGEALATKQLRNCVLDLRSQVYDGAGEMADNSKRVTAHFHNV